MTQEKRDLYEQVQRRLVASLIANSQQVDRVLELIGPDDIEEPVYNLIFQHIAELYRRDEIISQITVAERLQEIGKLNEVGGTAFLYSLSVEGIDYLRESSPVVYARIIKESSAKSKISKTLNESVLKFQDDSGIQAVDAVAEIQGELNESLLRLSDVSTMSSFHENFQEYFDLLNERKELFELNKDSSGLQGIPTSLPSLNKYTTGWLPGQMITVGARTGIGKALALDTPIITPDGWKTLGEISVGDFVFGRDGKPTMVTNVTGIQYNRKCFEIVFSNNERIIADADHKWIVEHVLRRNSKKLQQSEREQVLTTSEMCDSVRYGKDSRSTYSINVSEPLIFNNDKEAQLPIDPYIFGYWLGNGTSRNSSIASSVDDVENLLSELERAGLNYNLFVDSESYALTRFSPNPIVKGGDQSKAQVSGLSLLRELNVLQNKHIPDVYMYASIEQRKELLRGLIDSDGSVSKAGRYEFGITSKRLAEDARDLANSLGYAVFWQTPKKVKGAKPETSLTYSFGFKTHDVMSKLERKAVRALNKNIQRDKKVYIKEINEVDSVPVKCIQVDNSDHVYLAGKSMIPTHNSIFAINSAVAAASSGKTVMFFSLEMSKTQIQDRLISYTTGVTLNKLKLGLLSNDDKTVLKDSLKDMQEMKIIIDTEPNITIDMIRARALRQAQSPEGLDFIIVDYLQLITPAGRFSSRQEAVADTSRNTKLLAKQLGVPIMVLVQLNREDKGKDADEKSLPSLDQIRESGAIGQDSDIVILLHRPKTLDETVPKTQVILDKNRDGEGQKIITCHSNLETSGFREVTRLKDLEENPETSDDVIQEDFDSIETFDDTELNESSDFDNLLEDWDEEFTDDENTEFYSEVGDF